jgi:hypothetical protein
MKGTLAYLHAHLRPGDGVFGIPYVHRYEFLTNRATPTTIGTEMWDETARQRDRQRLTGELAKAKPRYIVFSQLEWPDADGIPWMDRLPELATFVFQNYHIVHVVGSTLIFELGPPQGRPPQEIDVANLNDVPFLEHGWFERSPDATGLARWTSTKATAYLYRSAGDAKFVLHLDFVPPPVSRTLIVRIDGKQAVDLRLEGDYRTISVPIPKGVPQNAVARVDFEVLPEVVAPDTRFLGVAVKAFGFQKR